jgi:NADH dehydrogenase
MSGTSEFRVVVLGGGYAGLTAAARIGEAGTASSLTLVDAKPGFVERIRLHEIAAGTEPRALPYGPFMAARGGRFIQGRATAIDAARRTVAVERADGVRESLPYDVLVYAPGSRTVRNAVPGAAEHAAALDDVDGSKALGAALGPERTLLIVGGGLTAIEAACEFAERVPGLRTVLAPGRAFAPSGEVGGLSDAGFRHVEETLSRLGVEVRAGARVAALRKGSAALEDGSEIPFDACLWAAGFEVPTLARGAGIAVNERGEVLTDPQLRSVSHPDIVAVGDAAHAIADPGGKCRMSCAAGRPMGELAAKTVAGLAGGGAHDPFRFSYSFRCVSLGRDDGLIQFVDGRDRPVEQVWTGARAARWKEYICRRTLAGIGLDTTLGPPPDTPPQIS